MLGVTSMNALTLRYRAQQSYCSYALREHGSFSPILQLKSNDSYLFLTFMMMRNLDYLEPIEVPLFSAHRKFQLQFTDNSTRVVYAAD
jgi:hypothetical protein